MLSRNDRNYDLLLHVCLFSTKPQTKQKKRDYVQISRRRQGRKKEGRKEGRVAQRDGGRDEVREREKKRDRGIKRRNEGEMEQRKKLQKSYKFGKIPTSS